MRRTRSCNKPEVKEELGTEWAWQDDDGQWVSYPSEVCSEINTAVQAGKKRVCVSLVQKYELDLVKMTQTNTKTKYRRQIRKTGCDDEGEGPSGLRVKEEEMPVTKKRRGGVKECGNTEEQDSKEMLKTIVMKGKAPVDAECKAKLGKAHVYSEGEDVYDVMLNQDDQVQVYSVWMRWGRVGKAGQNSLVPCGSDLVKAKEVFMKKFFDKTKNEWTQRANFEKIPGKYDMVFMDYSFRGREENMAVMSTPYEIKPSQLDVRLQSLMELICDIKAMEECVLEMKFDVKKAPLGKLTVEQIRAGYASLKRIEECLRKKSSKKQLLEACNQFYTRIPHDFGLRTPPIICNEEDLKKKIALLETLSDIEVAVKMVLSESVSDENPLDKHYRSLNCLLQPLDPHTHEYQVIVKYLQSTHAATHTDYTMTVLDIFSVEREAEKDNFLSHLHNRTLLWHGSRLSNWVGILSQGLRVAPPEAPVTGYMFGKGIYFADMSSKSANYCFTTPKNNVGLLSLSEVALGDCNELLDANYDADKLPSGKHSTKGLGQTAPDPNHSITLDGVKVPFGPAVRTSVGQSGGYTLLYNEFVVYNPAQIRIKYLLRIQFNYSALCSIVCGAKARVWGLKRASGG
ncbi:poly [ADP-ribose] polymerase 2 isoform X3 [Silurus meridionalis]|uniref:poly [ADP-ribose] polymerase 2 isoform X3 n=1 Tax=Silurus meridionalis TaxID=175797 RepID=UPI001EEBB62A|nr:poly [ADP-ribose] polymerase 2 isoform X3 [Silurus meridionalis]